MIDDLFMIEKLAYRTSRLHSLDPRVKILGFLAIVVAMVAIPYNRLTFVVGTLFLIVFAVLYLISGLPIRAYLARLLVILPFGLFICLFQIFFENRYYPVFHPVADLPFGIHIYAESIEFSMILLMKFIVTVSFVILLSSTTRLQDLLEGAGRLGLPAEFALVMGMMIRYLFVFAYMFRKISHSLQTRCFDPFDHHLSYRYRVKMLGYTIGTLFVRSYEQGERTYTAMQCRGYGRDSHLFIKKKPLLRGEMAFLAVMLVTAVGVPILAWSRFRIP